MMANKTWKTFVARVCGYFWSSVFKDTWLLSFIANALQKFIAQPILNILQKFKKQEAFSYPYQKTSRFPNRILVQAQSRASADLLKGIKEGNIINSNLYIYKCINAIQTPFIITSSISTPFISELHIFEDYKFDQNTFSFSFFKSLQDMGFKKVTILKQNQIIDCYQLWGQTQDTKYISDKLASLLQLPIEWTWLYPGSLYKAWELKQLGVTKKNCIEFLQFLTDANCYFVDYKNLKNSNIKSLPVIKCDQIDLIDIQSDLNASTGTFSLLQFLQTFKHNYFILKLEGKITDTLKEAISFIKKNLPFGTFLYLYTAQNLNQPSDTQYNVIKNTFYPLSNKKILMFKQDFDPVNP